MVLQKIGGKWVLDPQRLEEQNQAVCSIMPRALVPCSLGELLSDSHRGHYGARPHREAGAFSLSPEPEPSQASRVCAWSAESVSRATSRCPKWGLNCIPPSTQRSFSTRTPPTWPLGPKLGEQLGPHLLSLPGGGRNTARTKRTHGQHNYPPSVLCTKDAYLVIRTDPMVPGLGSSWKLPCVLTLGPVTAYN